MSINLRLLILVLFCFLSACDKREDPPPTTLTEFPFTPSPPPVTGDPLADTKSAADFIRVDFFGLLRDPSLHSITKEFGPTVITWTEYPVVIAPTVTHVIPWSSWWFPKRETFLFQNSDEGNLKDISPLEKYDLIRRSRAPNAGSAADFERNQHSTRTLSWEGLCDAWAIAAVAHPEPKRPVKIVLQDGTKRVIEFSVADLKALLLKTYEAVEGSGIKQHGQKFTGTMSGWIYPDLFPEQFHRFVEVQIFQKKTAFVMDYDSGVEVWNIPVFRANYTVDLIPNDPDSVFVKMWLYSAETVKTTEKNFVGTKQAVREYNYVLTGTRDENKNLIVNSGYWVKGPSGIDSRSFHPDYVIQFSDAKNLQQKSWNPEIDPQLVNLILSKSY